MDLAELLGNKTKSYKLITVKAMMYSIYVEYDLYKHVAYKLALLKALGYLDKLLYVALDHDCTPEFFFRFKLFEQEDVKNVSYVFAPNAYINSLSSCDEQKLSAAFQRTAEAFFGQGDADAMLVVKEDSFGIVKSIEKGNYNILDYATMISMPDYAANWKDC